LINSIESLRSQISVSLGLAETGISSIKDEIQFWRQKVEKSSTKSDKEAAKVFAQHFEGLSVMIDDSSKTKSLQNLRGLEDLIDRIQYALDEIWRLENFKYPQNRMVSLLDLLSSFVVERCVDELNLQDDVWSLNAVYMNELINDVMDVLNNWNTICDSLTRLFWTNCESHLWLGSPHASQVIEKFKTRLMDILDIWKKVHQQISILTSEDSTFSLSPNDYFSYFKSINIYDITPIGEKFWNISLHKFENAFSTIDEKIALNIKFSIQTSIDNPQEIINIFSQFENILKSHKIRNLLKIECNLLFEAIKMYVVKLEKSLSSWKRTPPDELQDEISHCVIDIRYLKVIEYQVNKLNSVCKNILTDHENYDEVMKIVDDFNDEIKTALKQNFNDWCENSSTMISSGELILKDNEPVVRFETTDRQQMTATYSEKLVIFCNDVSSLRNFGFMNLPNELLKYASIGRKYIKYAKNLQQISSFHNTIGDKIIPCHRPIMLKNAKEFSSLVRSESVSWNNEDSVQRYINILQSSIDNLSKDLNLLTSYHEKFKCSVSTNFNVNNNKLLYILISPQILRLMNTDMLKHSPVWKDEMKTLREHFVDLERKGYTNLQLFKVHWDYQLYKALEYQLVSLLIDSREKLQDIHIDIVFRNQQLQFRPTMEEIRFEYYQQIKKYIEMPLSFHGFSDKSKEIFSIMVHRNRSKFKSLYDRAERNFKRLTDFRDLWLPWIAIGCMNLENLCNVHLTQWEHWDKNFKSCKLFSQKIAKIQK
jgi:dynein heavy chain 2, cytosolic